MRWELVESVEDIRADDHLRARGYDDQELRRMPASELARLIALGEVRRKVVPMR